VARFVGLDPRGDVEQHVDAADQRAVFIEERCGERLEAAPRTVRQLGNRRDAANRTSLLSRDLHRVLLVEHRGAVEVAQLPRDAPVIAGELGNAARELDGGRVEVLERAFRIGDVDRHGKRIEHLAELPLALEQARERV
jgi:hypothetical protein